MIGTRRMESFKRITIWVVVGTLALVAFVWWNHTLKKNEQEAAARAQARKERATRLLNTAKAETRVFDTQQGQLLVIDMPLPAAWAPENFPMVETKRCMVWRDLETRTSAISCEADSDLHQ
ncbi:MAG: hypothetical protein COZ79_02070 [Hydrogenophilales bacterium CG_4_8_14_3_um_filter_62_83]|nr:MAG: hypothetical protein COW23_11335 [Hydrogenophilales bacterium CG15_BIG_FIL_POST_REV_8_21_14_020_62_31]PIW72451.1 MAG: hypothetical protein COW07_02960 [Hydrogenophilales bacterium CG12_big_fil_rev_8_21_14_0_65_61_21]PIX02373.1 MAG: hypothetical protein COZ79_02070 [Hydrogenophilales bacterium CG_4_8_14_3_um_filter_62_83]PIY99063.1 MAG: hypothetical protein COY64_02830 [Hydrogenophilales bacterium CG_4_10_14_0_8_um_filter_62_70]